MFWASRASVERVAGRIIQRMTRETTRGLTLEDLRAERKAARGLGVVVWRERRWRVQSGMMRFGDLDGWLR